MLINWSFFALNSWLVIIGLACFIWLSWRQTRHGINLIVLLLPSYLIRINIGGLPVTFLELMIVSLFLLWLIKDKRYQRINHHGKINLEQALSPQYRYPLIIILLAATISAIISPNQISAWGIWKAYFVEAFMFLLITVYTIKRSGEIWQIIDLLGITTIILAIVGIWQKITGFGIANPFWADEATRRITTIFSYPNASALLLAPVVAIYAAYLFKSDIKLKQLYKLVVLLLGLVTIYWSQSAGAIVAVIASIIIVLLTMPKFIKPSIIILVFSALCGIYFLSNNLTVQTVWQRIQTNQLPLNATSLEIRVTQWRETWQLLKQQPILGSGLANYQQALKPYHQHQWLEIYLYPHNILLNFWTELGLLGVIGFGWLIYSALRDCIKNILCQRRTILSRALLAGFSALLIHGLVDVPYFKNDLSVLFLLLVALISIVSRPITASTHATGN